MNCKINFRDMHKFNFDYLYTGELQNLINISTSMIKVNGLPETVNEEYFKTMMFTTGNCAIAKVDNEWYAVKATRGGKPNEYYIPTEYVFANPELGSKIFTIADNNIAMFYLTPFDEITQYGNGIFTNINRVAHILANIDVSIDSAVKKSRVVALVSCDNETTRKAIDHIIKNIIKGEDSFTVNQDYSEDLKVNPFLQGADIPQIIQQLTELRQYVLSQFYHSLGVNSNYNLKRAQISNDEIQTNDDLLIINTAPIMQELQKCVKICNEKTGLNISIEFSEEWKKLKEKEEQEEQTAEEELTADSDPDNIKGGDE